MNHAIPKTRPISKNEVFRTENDLSLSSVILDVALMVRDSGTSCSAGGVGSVEIGVQPYPESPAEASGPVCGFSV